MSTVEAATGPRAATADRPGVDSRLTVSEDNTKVDAPTATLVQDASNLFISAPSSRDLRVAFSEPRFANSNRKLGLNSNRTVRLLSLDGAGHCRWRPFSTEPGAKGFGRRRGDLVSGAGPVFRRRSADDVDVSRGGRT